MLSRCFLDFSVGVRASVIGLSQISSFSLPNRSSRSARSFTFYFNLYLRNERHYAET